MKIALSPRSSTKVTASYYGGEFSFEIKHLTINQQEEYDAIIADSIEKEKTVGNFYKQRFDYAIKNCTLKNPFDVLSLDDIKNILIMVNDVNSGVNEKKS